MARLKDQYINEIAPALNKKFGYKSVMQIPKLDKVVINVACGEAKENEKILESVMKDLAQITGQKAVICRAKKSVANFKLRAGTPIGCKVTLRGDRMYEFVDRFFNVALPRVRDFRGINGNAFDGRGNFACGIKGADYLPRDRLRQGRRRPRHGRLLRYHRQDRRRGQGAAEGSGRSVREQLREEITKMAKLSMKLKQARPAKFSTRAYTRCRICGRPHSVLRKYGICRVCFRELAYKGEIPGVKKASW